MNSITPVPKGGTGVNSFVTAAISRQSLGLSTPVRLKYSSEWKVIEPTTRPTSLYGCRSDAGCGGAPPSPKCSFEEPRERSQFQPSIRMNRGPW
jgi:hypothetical protein